MLNWLFEIIEERKNAPIESSYTTRLVEEGEDAILKKVGEEAMEVILAAKNQGNQRLIEEVADLLYHTLVLLAVRQIDPTDIEIELLHRHKAR